MKCLQQNAVIPDKIRTIIIPKVKNIIWFLANIVAKIDFFLSRVMFSFVTISNIQVNRQRIDGYKSVRTILKIHK